MAHIRGSDPEQDHAHVGFAALMLHVRLRLGLSQWELGDLIAVRADSIQGWESGTRSPSSKNLRALTGALLVARGFSPGRELAEAEAMWTAAQRQAPRLRMPFDRIWFANLLAQSTSLQMQDAPLATTRHHWGEAPTVDRFVGRSKELAILKNAILRDGGRVVAVLGMGGVGKTAFAAKLARDVAPHFERVYWTSLRNAPLPSEWLKQAIGFLAPQEARPVDAERLGQRLMLDLLRQKRCLLVLDNVETVLEPGGHHGRYREGFEAYGSLLRCVGEGRHRSCLLLTSREAPAQLSPLTNDRPSVTGLELVGLEVDASRALLDDKNLSGDAPDWASLVRLLGGNPLALRVVGETIRQEFKGDLSAFLRGALARPEIRFAGIRQVLDDQFARMSDLEWDVVRWLALEREPVSFAELVAGLSPGIRPAAVLEIMDALRRRSLLERAADEPALALQPVVLDYVTELVVHDVGEEILSGQAVVLLSHALVKATAREYVRSSQERLIAAPVLEHVANGCETDAGVEARLNELLDSLRTRPRAEHGYGPGNLVNLLRLLRGNIRAANLSELRIRQAYLPAVEAYEANLAHADLTESVIAEAFDYPVCLALSADGAYVAVGTATGEVRLWRLADRTLTACVAAHTGAVTGVALNADGTVLASAGMDGAIKTWNPLTAQLLRLVGSHAGIVRGLAMSAYGRVLASSGLDGTVRLWNPIAGQLQAMLDGHVGGAWCVELTADGGRVVSGSGDGTVKMWEPASGQLLSTVPTHRGGVRAVAVYPDQELVASGGSDGTVKLWLASGQLQRVLEGHVGAVTCLALSGGIVASGGLDHTIKFWTIATGELLATLDGHTGPITGVALSSDGRVVASGSQDGAVRVSESPAGRPVVTLHGRTGAVFSLALGESGDVAATGRGDGTIQLWDLGDSRAVVTVRAHQGIVYGLAMTIDGVLAASGGADGTARLWRVADGQLIATLNGHAGAVRGVALSGNAQELAMVGDAGVVKLWDVGRSQLVLAIEAHRGAAMCVALSETGDVMASGGLDGVIKLWRGRGGRSTKSLRAHAGGVWALTLSRDGQQLLSGGQDGAVKLWDVSAGKLRSTLRGHLGAVLRVTMSADGRFAASGGLDGTLNGTDVHTATSWVRRRAHPGGVMGLALSDDGRVLASCSYDGSITLSDPASGAELRTVRGPRLYEGMDITGLTGVTTAQREAMIALGAAARAEVAAHTARAATIE